MKLADGLFTETWGSYTDGRRRMFHLDRTWFSMTSFMKVCSISFVTQQEELHTLYTRQ